LTGIARTGKIRKLDPAISRLSRRNPQSLATFIVSLVHDDGPIGERLDYILDAIEALVLRADPRQTFELLVLLAERYGDANEQCADHHDTVQTALRRDAGWMAHAGQSLTHSEVRATLERLIAGDHYGAREHLGAELEALAT
jgi:hypothetical protein